jgi:hypothetical protein
MHGALLAVVHSHAPGRAMAARGLQKVTPMPRNEVQSIALTGTPSGGQFELSFGGQTTAEIPAGFMPPAVSMVWTFPVTAGHAYNIGVTWNNQLYTPACDFNFDVAEANAIVATLQKPGTGVPASGNGGFSDAGVFMNDGTTLAYWFDVNGSPLTASATSMQLVFSGTTGSNLQMSGIRVEDVTAGTITYYDVTDSANISLNPASGSETWQLVNTFAFDAWRYEWDFATAGTTTTFGINPGGSTAALVLQGALEALSSIGTGNISIADEGGNVYDATWIGDLAGLPQSLITCADPAVTITEITRGEADVMGIPWDVSSTPDSVFAGLEVPGLVQPDGIQVGQIIENSGASVSQVTYSIAPQSGHTVFDATRVLVGYVTDIDGTRWAQPFISYDKLTSMPEANRTGTPNGIVGNDPAINAFDQLYGAFGVLSEAAASFRFYVENRCGVPLIVLPSFKQG